MTRKNDGLNKQCQKEAELANKKAVWVKETGVTSLIVSLAQSF